MIAAGCDVGSLTAKAVIFRDGRIVASQIMGVKARAVDSARAVMQVALDQAGLGFDDIDLCCSTGYGRLEIPFAEMNMTEISCHAMGAHWSDPRVHTLIDIGGQDCKVVSIGDDGMVQDFIMNDKCAAGTGRNLELVAKALEIPLEALGPVGLKSRRPVEITNKCSVFMELEVQRHIYRKRKTRDIAAGVNMAVARRAANLGRTIPKVSDICITGGVSKNAGVVQYLEEILGMRFKRLPYDAQLMGAIGAAVLAWRELERRPAVCGAMS